MFMSVFYGRLLGDIFGRLGDLTKKIVHTLRTEHHKNSENCKFMLMKVEVAFGAHPTSLCVNGIGNFQNIT